MTVSSSNLFWFSWNFFEETDHKAVGEAGLEAWCGEKVVRLVGLRWPQHAQTLGFVKFLYLLHFNHRAPDPDRLELRMIAVAEAEAGAAHNYESNII